MTRTIAAIMADLGSGALSATDAARELAPKLAARPRAAPRSLADLDPDPVPDDPESFADVSAALNSGVINLNQYAALLTALGRG